MEKEEIIKLVLTLIGDFKPIGDQSHDKVSNENLAKLIGIVSVLHVKIDDVLTDTEKSVYKSEKDAHKMCDDYFDWLGVTND